MILKDPTKIEFKWIDAIAYIGGPWCDESEFKEFKQKWETSFVHEAGWLVAKSKDFVWVCRAWSKASDGYIYSGLMMIPKTWVKK